MLAMDCKNPLDSLSQSEVSIFHQHQMSPDGATTSQVAPLGVNDRSLQYMAEDSAELEQFDEQEEDEYDLEEEDQGHDSQTEESSPGI